jgi:hypothetical protein
MRKPKRAKAKAKATTKAKKVTRGKAKKAAKKASARKRAMRGAGAVAAGAAGVLLVNVIPKSLSSETNQDSEPMIAVNPGNTKQIVATAFTPDPLESGSAPYFFSSDGGKTWTLNTVVPGGDMTGDITVAFSGTGPALYAGILRQDSPDQSTRMAILRTADFSAPTPMDVLEDRQQPDQPFAQAATVANGSAAGKQRVYVGSNDFAGGGTTATLDFMLDAAAANPGFKKVRLERRSTGTAGQDGPQVRTSIHEDGTVYATFYGWRSQTGDFGANTLKVNADVVVVRDDKWGDSPAPFEDLKDAADGVVGQRIVRNVTISFNRNGLTANGQQRMGGTLSIAVDPRSDKSGTVYVAWGTDEADTGFTIHVRKSTNRGVAWSASDILTVPRATNAALAVNSDGTVGLLYQQLTGTGPTRRWETHLRRSANGGNTWSDLTLATTPAATPVKTFDPYLGDYDHMLAVGRDFYGIFSASNVPDMAHFPNGVTFQRNVDFDTRVLLDVNNQHSVPPSIDPFFFKVSG